MGIAEELSEYVISVKYADIPENIVHDAA